MASNPWNWGGGIVWRIGISILGVGGVLVCFRYIMSHPGTTTSRVLLWVMLMPVFVEAVRAWFPVVRRWRRTRRQQNSRDGS